MQFDSLYSQLPICVSGSVWQRIVTRLYVVKVKFCHCLYTTPCRRSGGKLHTF